MVQVILTMKHFLQFSLMLVLVALCSCNKAKNISVDNDKLVFAVNGGKQTIAVTADGNYDIKDCPEWLKVETEKETLVLTATANTSGAMRDCMIQLVGADEVSVAISVIQPDKCTYITVSPTEVTIPKEGGSTTVAIETDGGNLDVQVNNGITAVYNDGKLTVTSPANSGGTINGRITLTSDTVKTEVQVIVEGSICQRCGGTGKTKCFKCGGKGYTRDYWERKGFYCYYGCTNCGGSGEDGEGWFEYNGTGINKGTGKMTCPDCGGTGH